MFFIDEGQGEESEPGFEPEQHRTDRVTFDFAHIMYVGIRIGLSRQEVGRLRYGTWTRIHKEYKSEWNARMKKLVFAEDEPQSVLSL